MVRIIREDARKGSVEVTLMECIGRVACQVVDEFEEWGLKWTIRKPGGGGLASIC